MLLLESPVPRPGSLANGLERDIMHAAFLPARALSLVVVPLGSNAPATGTGNGNGRSLSGKEPAFNKNGIASVPLTERK